MFRLRDVLGRATPGLRGYSRVKHTQAWAVQGLVNPQGRTTLRWRRTLKLSFLKLETSCEQARRVRGTLELRLV